MSCVDVAIVGGGLAGSTAAAMLGRAGISTVLIDVHKAYPADFRAEKIVDFQIPLLNSTGVAKSVLSAATADEEVWIACFGRVVEARRTSQCNIFYDTLVNAVRGDISPDVGFVHAKVTSIALGPDRQRLVLSNGSEISARLVVLANGLNSGLRQSLGMRTAVLSECHSISAAFNVTPADGSSFNFRSLTYYSERPESRIGYLTLFLINSTMRANLFFYRDMQDAWMRRLREAPVETLFASLPNLRRLIGDIEVPDPVKVRPVDLYMTADCRKPGVVLVGDAFSTSCPAAGTGVGRVFTTWSDSAMFISRAGSPHREWIRARFPPSMKIRTRPLLTHDHSLKPFTPGRCRPIQRCCGGCNAWAITSRCAPWGFGGGRQANQSRSRRASLPAPPARIYSC